MEFAHQRAEEKMMWRSKVAEPNPRGTVSKQHGTQAAPATMRDKCKKKKV